MYTPRARFLTACLPALLLAAPFASAQQAPPAPQPLDTIRAAALQAETDQLNDAEREPLLDLLARSDATHVGLLSRSPLRVGLVRLPDLSRNTEAEIDLGLAFRMARLTAENRT